MSLLYPRGQSPWYPFNIWLGGPCSRPGHWEKRKSLTSNSHCLPKQYPVTLRHREVLRPLWCRTWSSRRYLDELYPSRPCHLPASPGRVQERYVVDTVALWRLLSHFFSFPLSASFHRCSILIFVVLLVWSGQEGEANKAMLWRISGCIG